jgi:hypothetical protein
MGYEKTNTEPCTDPADVHKYSAVDRVKG